MRPSPSQLRILKQLFHDRKSELQYAVVGFNIMGVKLITSKDRGWVRPATARALLHNGWLSLQRTAHVKDIIGLGQFGKLEYYTISSKGITHAMGAK